MASNQGETQCTVVSADREATQTTYENIMKVLTVQAFVETYGHNAAVRQLISMWQHQWNLSKAQVSALLEQISNADPLE